MRIPRMHSSRQQAYLEAMDVAVWSLREPVSTGPDIAVNHERLKLGPGNAGLLMICAVDTDSAGRLANDISRSLGSSPVWAWPSEDSGTVDLASAVEDNLFTTVAIFGKELALRFFEGELPANLNAAKLVLLPSIQDIQSRAETRRTLWATICRTGMAEKS